MDFTHTAQMINKYDDEKFFVCFLPSFYSSDDAAADAKATDDVLFLASRADRCFDVVLGAGNVSMIVFLAVLM